MRALLFSIVGAQLVCHAPRTGLNIFEMSKVTLTNCICYDSNSNEMIKALSTSPISLGQPWLIDLSHLLLVISASCNVVIYTAQVGNQIMHFLGLLGVRLFCVNLRNVTEFASNLNLTHTGTIHTAHTAELLSTMMFMKRCTQDVRFRNLLVSDLKRLLLLYRKKTDRLCFY